MHANILTLGTELTHGEIVDTNSAWLASELTALGFEVRHIDTVDDDLGRIQAALHRLAATSSVVICTGGLGPTTDDLTTAAVAGALGLPLVRDAASLAVIEARLVRRGRGMTESNAKQADFPAGAEVLPNARGSAPGFAVQCRGARLYSLPGVPSEMRALFAEHVAPRIRGLVVEPPAKIVLRAFGLPESLVNDRLSGVEEAHGVTIGYRAVSPEVEVKVLARGPRAREVARAAANTVRERLGEDVVYAEGQETLADVVRQLLLERKLTFGLAESCTGGLVASLIAAHAGASAVFSGAVVCYADTVKVHVLGVPAPLLAEHGAVSELTARCMAEGARRVLDVDIALALTGIAGPDGATKDKPVGLVHVAVSSSSGTVHQQIELPGARKDVQRAAGYVGLSLVRRTLLERARRTGV